MPFPDKMPASAHDSVYCLLIDAVIAYETRMNVHRKIHFNLQKTLTNHQNLQMNTPLGIHIVL